ncbi:PepSY domain-containing protein [Marinobacterium marinum]|uniref:PepSY domain-containing protein n=1 Tax=Marinobacterium marinum TaxID=2756129 RepID=A0A7W2ADI8_9GAMM|nr:PepSY domain-containing protein [Marinobacterium marinum]MBA4503624.1 PepSY domain-containing protein [Marinobacterium marinum]
MLAGIIVPVSADSPNLRQANQHDGQGGTERVDLVQASRIARMELGGEIIKAELTRLQGVEVYQVRLLDQGRVREALIDAATGKMLSPELHEESD